VPSFLAGRLPLFCMMLFFPIAGLLCCSNITKCHGLKWYLLFIMILVHVGGIIFIVYWLYGDEILLML
jgi:hypothetical protein